MNARLGEPRAELARLVGGVRARQDAPPEVPVTAVATVVQALFGGLVRQRRINPDSVPEELFGQALGWLFAGIAASGTAAGGDRC